MRTAYYTAWCSYRASWKIIKLPFHNWCSVCKRLNNPTRKKSSHVLKKLPSTYHIFLRDIFLPLYIYLSLVCIWSSCRIRSNLFCLEYFPNQLGKLICALRKPDRYSPGSTDEYIAWIGRRFQDILDRIVRSMRSPSQRLSAARLISSIVFLRDPLKGVGGIVTVKSWRDYAYHLWEGCLDTTKKHWTIGIKSLTLTSPVIFLVWTYFDASGVTDR